jgi:peptidoglycan/xylan/chitin deacetylase (PgdA/CDA1 family)
MEWILTVGMVALATWASMRWAWWRRTVDWQHPRILMYHMVREGIPWSRSNKLRVNRDLFERQVRWLKENGWTFATVSELVDGRPDGVGKVVALTFDDGYRDNLLNALPIMQKYRAKMTLYLVADRESHPDWPARRRADRAGSDLSREERLSNEEVRELLASGLVELGSHTMTHADLTQIVEEEKKWEIEGSKDRLKELFRVKVSTFCYPFGLYGEEDVEHARHADYKAAVTVQEGISDLAREDLMQLKRVKVSGKEGMFSFRLRIRTGRRS